MRQISDYDDFEHNGYTITTDLGSARFDFEDGIVTIQGHAYGEDKRQIEVVLEPEDTADFNISASAGDGHLSGPDLDAEAELTRVWDIETDENI